MLAIKWKKFSRKNITKAISCILLIICLMLGVFSALTISLKVENYESITVKDYMHSNTLSNEIKYAASRLEYILRYYKSEQNIKNGGTVKNLTIKDSWQLTNLYNNYLVENNYENNKESEELFWKEKSKEIEDIKDIIKKSDLSNYQQIIDDLNNPPGLEYYATDSKNICTNALTVGKNYFSEKKAYLLIDREGVEIKPENGESTYSPSLVERFPGIEEGTDNIKIYIAITDEGLATRTEKWNQDRYTLIKNVAIIALSIIIALNCLILLIAAAGRKIQDEDIHFIFIDKLYTDISLIIIIAIVALGIAKFYDVFNIRYSNVDLMKIAMLSAVAVMSAIFIFFFLSIVKHIKNRTLITYSVTYIVLKKIIISLVKVFNCGPLMLKTMAAIISLISCTLLSLYYYPPSIIIVLLIATCVAYSKVKTFKIIQNGIKVAKEGDYEYKINLGGNGEFKKLSDDINTITDGLKIAVQNKVKSERLKSELITNVSHDIKTPLTSIISYVDLLKREGLESPNAPKYLDVLDRKSNRLKVLTEDLFEAAKVTSGSIAVNFDKVNINSLVSQVLGELDEKIQESELDFKVSASEERIYAYADGRLLSRVMENLLSNIFKYALKGSRVYIDMSIKDKEVTVCFKNVSAYELNIPADELMGRFKRGDESRSSEGNGLGLAIAKSLMEIQKGNLEISIDGDLFKAEIYLKAFR